MRAEKAETAVMGRMRLVLSTALWILMIPTAASAQSTTSVRDGGASAIWILSNLAYAGMRAQGSKNEGWRIISFIFGFPGTLLTLLVVKNGGERAYGVDLPKRRVG
jgi:hypothetical protein